MKKFICVITSLILGSSACAKEITNKKTMQKKVKVEISEDGFKPAKIDAKKGEDLVLLVTRKTDKTCLKELKTINGSGEVKLPLNKEVEFKVGKLNTAGDVKLLCGMDMTAGIITVL
jgi:plastocyanin domain-containing protein